MKAFDREALEHLAFNIRRDIVATIATNGEGHVGGALSATDIVAVLYGAIMNYDPQAPPAPRQADPQRRPQVPDAVRRYGGAWRHRQGGAQDL